MTQEQQTLDLAAIRARWTHRVPLYPGSYDGTDEPIAKPFVTPDIALLCDELERLRAQNARLTMLASDADVMFKQIVATRPIVEAARAWMRYPEVDRFDVELEAVVAAYESAQVVQPSPVSASMGADASSQQNTAAGDQVRVAWASGERTMTEMRELTTALDERDATIARLMAELAEVEKVAAAREKIIGLDWAREDDLRSDNARLRAELNAAADALDNGGWALEVPLNQRDDIARTLHSARDAARAAAKECA